MHLLKNNTEKQDIKHTGEQSPTNLCISHQRSLGSFDHVMWQAFYWYFIGYTYLWERNLFPALRLKGAYKQPRGKYLQSRAAVFSDRILWHRVYDIGFMQWCHSFTSHSYSFKRQHSRMWEHTDQGLYKSWTNRWDEIKKKHSWKYH